MQNLTNDKLMMMLLVLLCLISAAVVLSKIGIFIVARRRGFHRPWLAWLPFGQRYLLGSIADQYRSLRTGVRKNRRILFTVLEVLRLPLFLGSIYFLIMVAIIILYGLLLMLCTIGMIMFNPDVGKEIDTGIVTYGLLSLSCLALLLPSTVLRSFVLLDYYRSCRPGSAVKYLVLGLFFPFLQPIFQFVCRRDDAGMPTPPLELTTIEPLADLPDGPSCDRPD